MAKSKSDAAASTIVDLQKQQRKQQRRSTLLQIARSWQLYLMLLPAFVHFCLFAYKPMYGVIIAFKDFSMRKGIWGSEWVGLDNFMQLFNSAWFPIILRNTLTLSVLALVVGFPLPIILALSLNEVKNERTRKFVQTVGYAPHFISTVVICALVSMIFSPTTGIVNAVIDLLGGSRIEFMTQGPMFKWLYVGSSIWQGVGWSSIIYYAALSGIDKSLIEAAELDGASRLQVILHVNLPTILPTVIITLIMQCGSLLGIGHEKAYLLQTDVTLKYSEVIATYVYKMGIEMAQFDFGAATGIFNSVINIVVLTIANTIARSVSETSLW